MSRNKSNVFSESLNALFDENLPTGYDFNTAPSCNCPKNCEKIEYSPELSLAHAEFSSKTNTSEFEGLEKYAQIERALNMPNGTLKSMVLDSASVLSVYYKSIGIVHYKRDEVYSIADLAGNSIRVSFTFA